MENRPILKFNCNIFASIKYQNKCEMRKKKTNNLTIRLALGVAKGMAMQKEREKRTQRYKRDKQKEEEKELVEHRTRAYLGNGKVNL